MSIEINGIFFINNTAPTEKLQVAGNVKVSGGGNGVFFPDGTSMTTAGATLGANTFTGNQSVTGTIIASGAINTNTQYNIGGSRVLSVAGQNNVFAGIGAGQSNS